MYLDNIDVFETPADGRVLSSGRLLSHDDWWLEVQTTFQPV